MSDPVTLHITELNRCNQRGGRMLSVFDLIAAQTLDLELAAFLMARVTKGASLLVGALPGGAGKTTVMCALLTLSPADRVLLPSTPQAVVQAAHKDCSKLCVICHEIGAGAYFGYLWGRALREYCALSERGCMLATNLHADDIDGARAQICHDNGVPLPHFNAFRLAVFLRASRGRHWIEEVHVSNGRDAHVKVFDAASGLNAALSPDAASIEPGWVLRCRAFLANGMARGIRTIEDTRVAAFDFLTPR